jgi:hypothetical protein
MENRKKIQEEQCEKSKIFYNQFENIQTIVDPQDILQPRENRFYIKKNNLLTKDNTKIPVIVKACYGKDFNNNDETLKNKIRNSRNSRNPSSELTEEIKCFSFYGFYYEMNIFQHVIPKIMYYSPNFVPSIPIEIRKDKDQLIYDIYNKELQLIKNKNIELMNAGSKNQIETFSGCNEDVIYILISKFIDDYREKYFETKPINPIPNYPTSEHHNKGYYITDNLCYLDEMNYRKVVVQIILTLAIMSLFKFSHNDLHPNNIRIENLDEPTDLQYYFGNEIYLTIPQVKYKVYFFDWDRAYVEEIGDNIELEFDCIFFENILTCNGYYLISDIIKILYHLKDDIKLVYKNIGDFAGYNEVNLFIQFFKRVFPNLGEDSPFPGNNIVVDNRKQIKKDIFFKDEDNPTMFFTRIFKDPYIKDILV